MMRKTTIALFALAAVGLAQPTAAFARGGGGGGGTEVVAVDTEAAWAEAAASMALDLVVAGASTAAVVASIPALVSKAMV